jgi:hypothetical protein
MVWSKEPTRAQSRKQSSFQLALDGRAPEELLEAGKYDWVSDYARQIVHSELYATEKEGTEIVLLASLRNWRKQGWLLPDVPFSAEVLDSDMNLSYVLTLYDPPEIGDALRLGAQYPDEQRNSPIVFPHKPWASPRGPSFVVVLRADENDARGLSYAPYTSSLDEWWKFTRVAVRKRPARPW